MSRTRKRIDFSTKFSILNFELSFYNITALNIELVTMVQYSNEFNSAYTGYIVNYMQ